MIDRRTLLKGAVGAAAVVMPPTIRKALAIPAASRSGTIDDVEHIIVLMQENRSFDHYFGSLRGVRGFGDRFPMPLPGGQAVWHQPDGGGSTVMPFHLDAKTTSAPTMKSLDHTWHGSHAALNSGRHDGWVAAKSAMTMGSFKREDIPFHYALADAFTICDGYFASLPGPTRPNRLFMMTGTGDPLGVAGGPVTEQPADDAVFGWETYPEMLETAGVSWLVYQGTDEDGPYPTHPSDYPSCYNELRAFKNFAAAGPQDPLARQGLAKRTPRDFARDVATDALPQIAWILPPYMCSEHPSRTPAGGAHFIAGVIDALVANPTVWAKTALFITYDENDGFFDHVPPPFPAADRAHSTVSTHLDIHDGDQLPFGLGCRVPMIVASPWSRGGRVNSQVFDHTSIIRFMERRFGVINPNISPWRRTVCGDLTSAFDFARPNAAIPSLVDAETAPAGTHAGDALPEPVIPRPGSLPKQEPGTRPVCPLPYNSTVDARANGGRTAIEIDFRNEGSIGACFHVFDLATAEAPRCYTVEAGKALSGSWQSADDGGYDLSIYGADGFFRRMRGTMAGPPRSYGIEASCSHPVADGTLRVVLHNGGDVEATFIVNDICNHQSARTFAVEARTDHALQWSPLEPGHPYDLEITARDDEKFLRRFAGNLPA